MRIAVVGGASGVGRELVTLLLDAGHSVLVLDRVAPAHEDASFIHVDLMDRDSVSGAAATVPTDLTGIAAVAGRADRDQPGDIIRTNYLGIRELIRGVMRSSALSTIASASSISASTVGTARAVLDRLLANPTVDDWRSVVGVLSPWDEYRLSKWLVERWTLALAAGFTQDSLGVRANVVSPAAIDTPLLTSIRAAAPANMLARSESIVGRNATPIEVARAFQFLLGADSSWVNGTTLRVDGGLMNFYEHRRRGAT